VLAQNGRAGDNALDVKVVAQQFAWQFTYPNGQTYGILRVPVDRSTRLDITAKDVLHSFWVPQLSQKQDAVVGEHNKLVITPTRTGTFPVICTELCGLGHALMRSRVEVMSQKDFNAWLRSGGQANAGQDPGLALFNQHGCNGCHTFTAAASSAQVGPDLDKLPDYAKTAKQPLEPFVRESILDPDKYVQPGYQAGVMPSFDGQIPAKDLDTLVKFLAENAKQ
jgi:cytochrome c oxidase subunit 2